MPRSQNAPDRTPRTPDEVSDGGDTAGTPTDGTAGSLPDDVGALSYEEARDELVRVVARLEAGGETLEGALALWERGEALAARCQQWLDGARARLDAVRGAGDDTQDAPDHEEPA